MAALNRTFVNVAIYRKEPNMRIANSILGLTARAILKLAAGLGMAALALSGHAGTMSVNQNCAGGMNYSMYSVTVDSSGNYAINCSGTPTSNSNASTPAPGTMQFSSGPYTGSIGGSNVSVIVTRSGYVGPNGGPLNNTVTVSAPCSIASGGVNFADAVLINQTVSVAPGASAGTCNLAFQSQTGVGSPSTATITIVDPAAPGSIAFTSAGQAATAGQANTVTISAGRPGAGSQAPAATANYGCVIATSPTGGAYAPTFSPDATGTGTLSWAAGDITAKSITATIPAFVAGTTGATITCNLSNVTGTGVTPGSLVQHVVSIAAPSSIPANCTVTDVTWIKGLSYISTNAPQLVVSSDMAFRAGLSYFNSKSSGAYKYGMVEVYQLGTEVTYSLSASPCTYQTSPPAGTCQGTLSPGPSLATYYVSANSPGPLSGYCQLPPLPAGQTFYYVNLRPTNPAATGSFWLLFD
jgi:hypothetical protein